MAVATAKDSNEALARWLLIQSIQPAWLESYCIKQNGGKNPLSPWPPDEDELQKFLLASDSLFHTNEEKEALTNTIDRKKLEDFAETLNRESARATAIRTEAEQRAHARMQDAIRLTLEQKTIDPNQRELVARELISQSDRQPDVPVEKLVPKAVEFGESAQPFLHPDLAKAVDGPLRFTQIKGLAPIQKAVVAPILDVIVTVFPNLRQGTMNKDFEEAFRNLLNAPDAIARLTGLFGKDVVESRLFQQMLGNAKTAIPTGSTPGGAKTIVDDIASSLFYHAPEQAIMTYWKLYITDLTKGIQPPTLAEFQASGMNVGASFLNWGLGVGLGEARGAALKSLASKLGLELAIPGGGWAAALLTLGSSLLGKAGNWIKGLAGIKQGEVPGDRWLLGIGCGAILLIFFIIPLMSQFAIDNSLINHLQLNGGAPGSGTSVDCSQTPDDPSCKFTACTGNCQWPASGTITQGPFTAGYCGNPDQTSHDVGNAANGIDIANGSGGPIYAPRAGTVIEAYTKCPDYTGKIGNYCGGSPAYAGYGNHVILKTDDGYTLIFGHMESAMNVTAGQHVDAGTQLGWMDNTGNTTGTHVHFGVLSGGSILDFIPKGDPAHTPEAITGCVDGESSCKKTCPYAPVSAGK